MPRRKPPAKQEPSEHAEREPERIGKYVLGEALGQGPLGIAFAAMNAETGERVVLRGFARPQGADRQRWQQAVARFTEELTAAARLDHPAIVRLIEFGEVEGVFCIITESIRVEPLRHRMDRSPRLTWEELVPLVRQVAEVIDYAHSHHTYHGDLTPFNILLLPSHQVKILNYGMGHVRKKDDSPYQAPEQAAGHAGDHLSDLYALGIILYEILAGHPPFQSDGADRLKAAILSTPPPPIAGISPALQAVIRRLLAKNPQYRYPSGAELVADLERIRDPGWAEEETPETELVFIGWTPPVAQPLPSLADFSISESDVREIRYQMERQRRRRRRLVTQLATLAAAMVVGGALLFLQREKVQRAVVQGSEQLTALKQEAEKTVKALGAAGDTARAATAIRALITTLASYDQYPTSVDPTTLKGLELSEKQARLILSSFTGDRLAMYRSDGSHYELRARSKDGHTLYIVKDGEVETITSDE